MKPMEVVDRIEAALEKENPAGSSPRNPYVARRVEFLQTVLIVQALDRLTDAVKSLDSTISNASLPDGHPSKYP